MSDIDLSALKDPRWRLGNLYTIVNDDAQEIAFSPFAEQWDLYNNLHYRNLILKARKIGFSTFTDVAALDQCLFNPNFTAAVIADTRDNAAKLFRNNVLTPYRRLPELVKRLTPIVKDTSEELVFANGSSISVSTSARGGTPNFLHVSEMGKIARRYPEKAKEIVSGSFEAVPKTGVIIVESTAEGRAGWFYDAVQDAKRMQQQGSRLSMLDWRLHFYAWWQKFSNRLTAAEAGDLFLTDADRDYFDKLERIIGQKIDHEQRLWYVVKRDKTLRDANLMMRENPGTPDEAFAVSLEGMIFGQEMSVLRALGRIGPVPVRPRILVNTFWDLGLNDTNTIWLHQRVGAMNRFVGYIAGSNEGMGYYADKLEKWRRGWCSKLGSEDAVQWGRHYLPHDGDTRIQGYTVRTRKQILEEDCGLRDIQIVRRIDDKLNAIAAAKAVFGEVEFDAEACAEGIRCLDNYSRDWNEDRNDWLSQPRHDWASHGADSFLQFAQSFLPDSGVIPPTVAPAYARGY